MLLWILKDVGVHDVLESFKELTLNHNHLVFMAGTLDEIGETIENTNDHLIILN